MTETLHVVHPAFVISATDGDRHFIGFAPLARLHNLNPNDPNVVNAASGPMTRAWIKAREAEGVPVEHYHVSATGNYGRKR
jgi:hypothetical protein